MEKSPPKKTKNRKQVRKQCQVQHNKHIWSNWNDFWKLKRKTFMLTVAVLMSRLPSLKKKYKYSKKYCYFWRGNVKMMQMHTCSLSRQYIWNVLCLETQMLNITFVGDCWVPSSKRKKYLIAKMANWAHCYSMPILNVQLVLNCTRGRQLFLPIAEYRQCHFCWKKWM